MEGNKKFARAIIPDETFNEIVMNISQIYKFDSEFLKALEDRMETWYAMTVVSVKCTMIEILDSLVNI